MVNEVNKKNKKTKGVWEKMKSARLTGERQKD
jgi:hypothetical protein